MLGYLAIYVQCETKSSPSSVMKQVVDELKVGPKTVLSWLFPAGPGTFFNLSGDAAKEAEAK